MILRQPLSCSSIFCREAEGCVKLVLWLGAVTPAMSVANKTRLCTAGPVESAL